MIKYSLLPLLLFISLTLSAEEFELPRDQRRALFGVGLLHTNSDNLGIQNRNYDPDSRGGDNLRLNLGGIMVDYYHSRFFYGTAAISFGHSYEYRHRGGDLFFGGAERVVIDLSGAVLGRLPIGDRFTLVGGLGGYAVIPIANLSGTSRNFAGNRVDFNVGMLVRAGMDIGLNLPLSIYVPIGFEARFDFRNGFFYGYYIGVGVRL